MATRFLPMEDPHNANPTPHKEPLTPFPEEIVSTEPLPSPMAEIVEPLAGSPPEQESPVKSRKAYSASHWQVHAWGIGGVASYFMYEQFYLITNIHTTVFKIEPVIVFAIMAMPRLVDGLIDPVMGHWSDNMHSRWGRRRPFLLGSAIVGAVLASALFWMSPDWPQWVKSLQLAVCAITLFTACGTYDMAFNALGYELSDEYADRSRIQAIKGVYWALFAILGGYVIWLAGSMDKVGDFIFGPPSHSWFPLWEAWRPHVLNPLTGKGDEVLGFRVVSLVVSLLILLSVIFPLLWSKERFTTINRTKVNLMTALRTVFRSRPFIIILLIKMAGGAGTLPRNLFFYIGTYSVCFGDKQAYTEVMSGHTAVVSFFIAIGIWWATKPLTRLIGKRAAFIGGAGLTLLHACLMPLIATPGHVWDWFFLNIAFMPVQHILTTSAAGIMPDICDIDELEHGTRREGLFTAVQAFVSKMEISLMTALTGVFLTFVVRFDVHLTQQAPEVIERLRFWGFAPLIVLSAISFGVSWFMPLTKKMMDDVRAQLDERHAAHEKARAAA